MNPEPSFFSNRIAEARRFCRDLSPPRAEALRVVCGGYEQCRPDYRIERRSFPFYAVELVACGAGQLRLKGQSVPLLPGVAFTYGPGVSHRILADVRQPPGKYFVDFVGRQASRRLQELGLVPGTVRRLADPRHAIHLLDALLDFGTSPSAKADRVCARLLEALLELISGSPQAAQGQPSYSFATFERCRRFIEGHWPQLKSTRDIAAACHVDAAYLCRLFRQFAHTTPGRYLLRLRMAEAAARLQTPGAMVKNVASDLGFADPFHFSRTFKRILGIPPARLLGLTTASFHTRRSR